MTTSFHDYSKGGQIPVSPQSPLPVTSLGSTAQQAAPNVVRGRAYTSSITFTRPDNTTAYTAGDVIGSAVSANLELPNAGAAGSLIQVMSASVLIRRTVVPTGMTTLRLHLWDASPASIADNAPFAAADADATKYAGTIELPAVAAVGGGFVWTFADYVGRPIRMVSTSLFANLVTIAGVTPSALTEYRIRLHCVEVGA